MKLIMTGGGDSAYFLEIDAYFMSLLGEKPRLLYFPFAQDKKNWGDGRARIAETFSSVEFSQIEICKNLKDLEWDYLKRFDAIYIDGGNTFKLMDKFKNTHGYELIKRFLFHGGVINGDSAGAIVLGSHIATAHFGDIGDENGTKLISYQGLNTLGSWSIHCHYKESEDYEIMDFVNTYGFPVIALSETTAVSIDSDKIKVIGESPLVVFMPNREADIYLPGDEFFIKRW